MCPEGNNTKAPGGEFALWRNLPTIVPVSKSDFISDFQGLLPSYFVHCPNTVSKISIDGEEI